MALSAYLAAFERIEEGGPSPTVRSLEYLRVPDSWINDKYIRAGSPSTAIDELRVLATDEIDNVRRRVGENHNTPPDILISLAEDGNCDVRIAVAENPGTPQEVVHQLSCDESTDVRYALAENPNLSVEILEKLTEDPNPYVSHRAQRTLMMLRPSTIAELKPRMMDDGEQRIQNYRMRL
jgi:hypothetical protein